MNNIEYLIVDVDGTLTDGKIYMGNDGELFKVFNIKDGYGLHDILIPSGIQPVIITGRSSSILERRCKELGIKYLYQGIYNKVQKLKDIFDNTIFDYKNLAYIGDDINDLSCMKLIKEAGGVIGCPVDAVKQVVELADFVCSKSGGDGAVREFIEWLISLSMKIE